LRGSRGKVLRRKFGLKGKFGLLLLSSVMVFAIIILAVHFYGSGIGRGPRAVIVDGLIHHPNREFIEAASELLRGRASR